MAELRHSKSWRYPAVAALSLLFAACTVNVIDDGDGDGDGDGDDNVGAIGLLFAVNQGNLTITSYDASDGLDGEELPFGELPSGSATSIFQPRAVTVTTSGLLLISRQNGGIVGFEEAETADGSIPADRVIEGNATGLDSPISFAYDAENDRLYVGNISSADGILVFDNVSDPSFDGNVPPDRTFGPPDRQPFDVADMTIAAMDLDSQGRLFVADQSGLFLNSSRILVFDNPDTADGMTDPDAVLESSSWGVIESLAVADDDTLLVADSSDEIQVFDFASTLDGVITPNATIVTPFQISGVDGIYVDANGVGYVSDNEASVIYTYENITSLDGQAEPDAILEGSDTELRSPRQIFLVEQ